MPSVTPAREQIRLWAPGAFDAKSGAECLSVNLQSFLTIAATQKWPRKYVKVRPDARGKVVYPRRLIVAYLAACPDAPPLNPPKPPTGLAARRVATA